LSLRGTALRMVVNPTEMSIRFFGFSHYTVATYLLVTSKKIRNLRGFVLLSLFGVLAGCGCVAFYLAGGRYNFLAVLTVFFFFLMHGLRDEVFFYRLRSGKAITDEEYPHVYRMLIWLQLGALCLLAALLYPGFIYKYSGDANYAEFNAKLNALFPADWPIGWKMFASSAPLLFVSAICAARIQSQHRGGIFDLLASHRPLSVILGCTVVLALFSIVAGIGMLNFLILIHFTGWFIFATAGIAKEPKEKQRAVTWRQPNLWIRQNMVGFWVFHGGLAAMFFALIALNHWVFAERPMTIRGATFANPLTILFSQSSFYYWTIFHVTLGFLPKPAPKRR
jgi:hypothetical protein